MKSSFGWIDGRRFTDFNNQNFALYALHCIDNVMTCVTSTYLSGWQTDLMRQLIAPLEMSSSRQHLLLSICSITTFVSLCRGDLSLWSDGFSQATTLGNKQMEPSFSSLCGRECRSSYNTSPKPS